MSGQNTEFGPIGMRFVGIWISEWPRRVKSDTFRMGGPRRTRLSPWRRWQYQGQADTSDQRCMLPMAVPSGHVTNAPGPLLPTARVRRMRALSSYTQGICCMKNESGGIKVTLTDLCWETKAKIPQHVFNKDKVT